MSTGPSIKTNTDFRVICLTGAALPTIHLYHQGQILKNHTITLTLSSSILRVSCLEATTTMQEGYSLVLMIALNHATHINIDINCLPVINLVDLAWFYVTALGHPAEKPGKSMVAHTSHEYPYVIFVPHGLFYHLEDGRCHTSRWEYVQFTTWPNERIAKPSKVKHEGTICFMLHVWFQVNTQKHIP